jgi:hypothetical protein
MANVPFLPNVKFSTASAFFKTLEKYDLSKIPVVKTELNTTSSSGFFGTYTTHSDMKRWNRDAEAITESAEAIAAFASRYGFAYPQKEFGGTGKRSRGTTITTRCRGRRSIRATTRARRCTSGRSSRAARSRMGR